MLWLYITLGLIVLIAAAAFVLYLGTLYVKPRRRTLPLVMPDEALQRRMNDADMNYTLGLTREIIEHPHEKVFIRSYDGLRLAGRFMDLNHDEKAPLVILCHGYRGTAAADFRGIFQQVRGLGYNILLINERAHWESEGSTITLGVRERKDILAWANYAAERVGRDTPIALFGVSMGAASVLWSTELGLPENVRAIIADCGFSTPRGILMSVLGQLKLKFVYPLVWLGAFLFAHIVITGRGPIDAVRKTKLPILFIHGEIDNFVPCDMSREMYEAAGGEKQLETFPGAKHLHSCLVDEERYLGIIGPFLEKHIGNRS
ncbi:MAG: alpha/beta hydrolase [Clostridia bacterium]|nr:alpha/beta hydrolase [Clostridia bacterium]